MRNLPVDSIAHEVLIYTAIIGVSNTMQTKDYFTQEQLERRVSDARSEIRYLKRKILIEQVGTTITLLYFLSEFKFPGIATLFMLNFCGWVLWIYLATRRVVGGRRVEPPSMDFGDDYRRLSYYLSLLSYQEAVVDLLTGLQFICLVGLIVARFYFIR